jgi:hypothetical protein
MKTLLFSLLCGCLLTINTSFAQQPEGKMLEIVTITANKPDVSDEVWKSFQKSFETAGNMKWYKLNKNFLVKFIKDDQEHNVLYQKNGSVVYHISYGFEHNLPMNIRNLVNSKYSDYSMKRVINIKQDSRNIYAINLEDEKNMILVRVEAGILDEVNRFKNASVSDALSSTSANKK